MASVCLLGTLGKRARLCVSKKRGRIVCACVCLCLSASLSLPPMVYCLTPAPIPSPLSTHTCRNVLSRDRRPYRVLSCKNTLSSSCIFQSLIFLHLCTPTQTHRQTKDCPGRTFEQHIRSSPTHTDTMRPHPPPAPLVPSFRLFVLLFLHK